MSISCASEYAQDAQASLSLSVYVVHVLLERHAFAIYYSKECGEWVFGEGVTGFGCVEIITWGLVVLYFLSYGVISVWICLWRFLICL